MSFKNKKQSGKGGIEQLPLTKYRILFVQHEIVSDPTTKDPVTGEELTVYDYTVATNKKWKEKIAQSESAKALKVEGLGVDEALEMVGYVDNVEKAKNSPRKEVDSSGENSHVVHNVHQSYNKLISELSGGWKMRLALAVALMQDHSPDVLLLDEPTNHLDVAAVKWLSDYLSYSKNFKRTAIITISHDAGFLNTSTTDIIHFAERQLTYFPGNFENFTKQLNLTKEVQQNYLDIQNAEEDDGTINSVFFN